VRPPEPLCEPGTISKASLGASARWYWGSVALSFQIFRNIGTECASESGVKWMSGSTKRQCDRGLSTTCSPCRRIGVRSDSSQTGCAAQAAASSSLVRPTT
jgi:hypothetical protein